MPGDDRALAGVCGCYCGTCGRFAANTCRGCAYELGLTSEGECCVFQCCVAERGLEHCGLCADFPCSALYSRGTAEDVRVRLSDLVERIRLGTRHWLDARKSKG